MTKKIVVYATRVNVIPSARQVELTCRRSLESHLRIIDLRYSEIQVLEYNCSCLITILQYLYL